ncbi:D-alanyl-D-alanine carboxypeptidase/D-alanyl-D-alanine-endopeptidase [Lusitaniella coriacea LEGE 07157]|uniref:D-alanyl-D-alanine carboxypeptidase/D-alanyl-D-alanine-endopeptidase n=1 Tax=Lusitaniella coriacea LEGE 07157 TaxID=945747 RepID=A0A8J7E296_9CYAN|nr:D-alanyl-D-alanine carboxypeptidase/D-alanyl-D-alanine-endopeptidase [Lusitaniella coriacea]MBE9119103.1 D-alanyl-D-alanine carboxypeptidase/D-alanyl-D-alanine-endopeptidase [Lusitaniella coriacea LEGE 07157]
MLKVHRGLQSLAAVVTSAIALSTPLSAIAASPSYLRSGFDPIGVPVPPPEPGNAGICPAFLEPAISAIVDSPSFSRGKWGILIESLDGQVLYRRNENKFLIPASNIKLLTTAAALQRLNPQTRIRSTSLRQWVVTTNRASNNNYANVLLRYIGGPQAVKTSLARLGINSRGYRQVDGSGLSRSNAATPTTFVDVLQAMYSAQGKEIWQESLPVAGVSGTLRNRLRNTPAQGRVRAKTGTLRGVKALSGYMDHPEYGPLVFSILVNQPNQSGARLAGAIDAVILRLTRLTPC